MQNSRKDPLSITHPQLATQWHQEKNGTLTPSQVLAGSEKKAWWICPNNSSHEWEAVINSRVRGNGCPFCSGHKASIVNSLASLYPEIVKQWHPTRNGTLTPDQVTAYSNQKVWWKCPNCSDHEWEVSPASRTSKRTTGCPFCSSRKVSISNSLTSLYPEIAKQWHSTKNGTLTPNQVSSGSHNKVWWKCAIGIDHEWETSIANRVQGKGCPFCAGQKVSVTNSLATLCPELAKQWHPEKNGTLTPSQVTTGSTKKVWWVCTKYLNHEWEASIGHRVSGRGCPFCSGRKPSTTNSLASLYPEIAAQWHPTRNGELTPHQVVAGSHQKVWWICPKSSDHEWEASIGNKVKGRGCPFCAGQKPSVTNSLASLYPEIAAQWHPIKNGSLTPDLVMPGSEKKAWWKCPINPTHEWQASIYSRANGGAGCPACNNGWTVGAIRGFVASLINYLNTFTPAELYLLFQQSGLLQTQGKGKGFVKALVTGRFPIEELEKFVKGEPSLADEFHQDKNLTLEALETNNNNHNPETQKPTTEDQIDQTIDPSDEQDDLNLPIVQTKQVLKSLDHHIVSSADAEAVEFLIASAKAKIWKHTFQEETTAITQAETYTGDSYAQRVKSEFLDEYHRAKNLQIPTGYAFQINGKPAEPNLMQRLIAVRVRDNKRVGNWSGTGAGKTLSAVLASRVINAQLTLICCPNSVVEGWKNAILDIFPESQIATKTFTPNWQNRSPLAPLNKGGTPTTPPNTTQPNQEKTLTTPPLVRGAGGDLSPNTTQPNQEKTLTTPPLVRGAGGDLSPNTTQPNQEKTPTTPPLLRGVGGDLPRYLILNYEKFQQPESPDWVRTLIESEQIDFIVIDEIHYTKQRQVEDMSRRKELIGALIASANEQNPNLHIIGMSATPVINNLQEGKSLVEMVTGVAHNELDIRPTIPNCMKLHQRLVTLGIRWMPEYNLEYEQIEIPVDCGDYIDQIRALGKNGTPLELEKILTHARLPVIRQQIQPKTLIYTHYIQGIDSLLKNALEADGWRVGFYTGEDKSGLPGFLKGEIDVLIGSSAIGTGVDGLQHVCNQLIINVLPWTHAEFEQLKGRIYRQGQVNNKVKMVIPLTFATVNGQHWSWCESKMQRLRFKKSIADAAVDGVVPEGHLRTPAQAYQDVISWLERLESGELQIITRPKIIIPIPEIDPTDVQRRLQRYGDFSQMNRLWNQTHSAKTHQRLQENPEEWAQYHTLYQESRKDWAIIPYEEMIRWCQQRSGYVIGDFGCGEAKLAEAISDRHTVYSFDHIAINNNVIACDMSHVPLNDEELDVAIFSLSLMGCNFTDYLREARRTLKLDGQLHIIEATSRFGDINQFCTDLEALGFAIISLEDMWKFTHITARKTYRKPQAGVELKF
ncbi:methyltransferase domain-containing protein [Phormidium sp. LEGE 05292]|uniref:zinc-ribbon domain-containing protein n=1 Tax=[Phormidium] sp. LEGE 05292 TaxID=767427 RepID=UPI0018803B11|nr:zinc-ribbon domain-containing protein [Phormidium sp. LEGE 05292]MBE9224205.1 methyltransferase domain-containing protein [Phormidium sp. LEGE 05292]